MIKINLAIPYQLQKSIYLFEKKFRERTFAGRNPQLGRMVNCGVCDRRHREAINCKPVYATHDKQGNVYQEVFDGENWLPLPMMASQETHKGVLGANQFKGRRLNPHHSALLTRFLVAVREYYEGNLNYTADVPAAKRQAYSRAVNEFPKDTRRRIAQAKKATRLSAVGIVD